MRIARRVLLVIVAFVLILIAYRVLGVYRLRSGDCSAAEAHPFKAAYPHRVLVMTYNIEGHATLWRKEHIREIAETIARYHPDIVGLNEVHRWTWQSRFEDQVGELQHLTGMKGAFAPSYTFMGGQFGNAILTRGDLISSDAHSLPGTGEPRAIFHAVVRLDGGVVDFYVAHTSAWGSINRGARRLQLECMSDHVQASDHPFILTGDFNAPPDSPEIAKFLGTTAFRFVGDPHAATQKMMGERIDYILTDPGWVVRSSQVLDTGPSDHRPVLAELTHP